MSIRRSRSRRHSTRLVRSWNWLNGRDCSCHRPPATSSGSRPGRSRRRCREGAIGPVRLVYAELDDGLIHRMRYRHWRSEHGISWPSQDEFEVGCTLEHAGYYLSWLAAFFGPAESITAFASCQIPDKQTDVPLGVMSPDFSVAAIRFGGGVVARVTCSIIAPHDHRLRIFGDDGVLSVEDCWDYRSPVRLKQRTRWALFMEKFPLASKALGLDGRRYPMVKDGATKRRYQGTHRMDFARGVAEMADAITEGRPSRLSARFSLHVNELVLAMQDPESLGCPRAISSTFEPMDWVRPEGAARREAPRPARVDARAGEPGRSSDWMAASSRSGNESHARRRGERSRAGPNASREAGRGSPRVIRRGMDRHARLGRDRVGACRLVFPLSERRSGLPKRSRARPVYLFISCEATFGRGIPNQALDAWIPIHAGPLD